MFWVRFRVCKIIRQYRRAVLQTGPFAMISPEFIVTPDAGMTELCRVDPSATHVFVVYLSRYVGNLGSEGPTSAAVNVVNLKF